MSGAKLFDNAVLEAAARADLYEFEDALAVFAALREPDVNLPSAYFFYLALASRVRAALRGAVEETERRVRESRLLEDALVLLFARAPGGGARSSLLPRWEPGPPEARFRGTAQTCVKRLGADGPGAPKGEGYGGGRKEGPAKRPWGGGPGP